MGTDAADDLDVDAIILLVLVLLSGWAFVTAFQFPERDALFPQIASGIVLLGALLLLGMRVLPESVAEQFRKSEELFETEEMEDEEDEEADLNPTRRYQLMGLIAVYLVVGYLIGLLWATPVFVLLYGVVTDQTKLVISVTTLVSFAAAYVFMVALHLSIDRGVLMRVVANVL